MNAIIVTELERAIINCLRRSSPEDQYSVCFRYGLPAPNEAINIMLSINKWSPETQSAIVAEQRKAEKRFILEGYGNAIEIGKKEATPFLSTVESRK